MEKCSWSLNLQWRVFDVEGNAMGSICFWGKDPTAQMAPIKSGYILNLTLE